MTSPTVNPPTVIGKHVEAEVHTPGYVIAVCRRRKDGYTRIEVHDFAADTRTSFYLNDEERRQLADAVAMPAENPRTN